MAFCGYCGAQMPDDMSFCTECGKPLIKKNGPVKNQESESDNIQTASQVIGNENHEINHEENTNSDNDNTSDLKLDEEDVKRFESADFYERKINVPEDAVLWSTSHLENDQNNKTEDLYQSLKTTNAKKEKTEKKKFILPLAFTLIFLGIAIAVVIIKFKPYEKWINRTEESVVEADDATKTESVEEEREDISATPSVPPTVAKPGTESYKDPEITDMLVCFRPINQYSDYVYIDYCYEIYNPNSDVMITSMKLDLSVRNSSDAILGTSTARANIIMPGDTVYAIGTLQLTKSEAAQIDYDDTQYEWDYATESRYYSAIRTSEIVVSNISARGTGYDTKITGEIKNNSSYDTSAFTKVYALFWKDDELVAIDYTYVDQIYSGVSRVFEINGLQNIPDYDTVQIFVDVW